MCVHSGWYRHISLASSPVDSAWSIRPRLDGLVLVRWISSGVIRDAYLSSSYLPPVPIPIRCHVASVGLEMEILSEPSTQNVQYQGPAKPLRFYFKLITFYCFFFQDMSHKKNYQVDLCLTAADPKGWPAVVESHLDPSLAYDISEVHFCWTSPLALWGVWPGWIWGFKTRG